MPSYTVKRGDNLSAIARRAGVDVRDLIAANPQIADTDLIQPGQRIRVPTRKASASARAAASARIAAGSNVRSREFSVTGQAGQATLSEGQAQNFRSLYRAGFSPTQILGTDFSAPTIGAGLAPSIGGTAPGGPSLGAGSGDEIFRTGRTPGVSVDISDEAAQALAIGEAGGPDAYIPNFFEQRRQSRLRRDSAQIFVTEAAGDPGGGLGLSRAELTRLRRQTEGRLQPTTGVNQAQAETQAEALQGPSVVDRFTQADYLQRARNPAPHEAGLGVAELKELDEIQAKYNFSNPQAARTFLDRRLTIRTNQNQNILMDYVINPIVGALDDAAVRGEATKILDQMVESGEISFREREQFRGDIEEQIRQGRLGDLSEYASGEEAAARAHEGFEDESEVMEFLESERERLETQTDLPQEQIEAVLAMTEDGLLRTLDSTIEDEQRAIDEAFRNPPSREELIANYNPRGPDLRRSDFPDTPEGTREYILERMRVGDVPSIQELNTLGFDGYVAMAQHIVDSGGQMPAAVTSKVWEEVAALNEWDETGEEFLERMGYALVPALGPDVYIRNAPPGGTALSGLYGSPSGFTGSFYPQFGGSGGGIGGGGGGGGRGLSPGRGLSVALHNWRIGASGTRN